MSLLYFSSIFLSCGEKETTEDTTITTEPSAEPSNEEVEDPCIPEEGAEGFRMEGNVQFIDGTEGAGNVRVQMCNSQSCYIGKWGDNGFCFPEGVLSAGYSYAFDAVPLIGEENQYATPLTFITVNEGEQLLQLSETLIIPGYSNSTPSTETEFDAGNGLTITIGEEEIEGGNLFGTPVNNEEWGLPLPEFENRDILGIWYLGPFETHFGIPWHFSFSSQQTENMPEGAQIEIYNADYDNQEWKFAGTATKSSDGFFVTDANSGISILSTLVLVQ